MRIVLDKNLINFDIYRAFAIMVREANLSELDQGVIDAVNSFMDDALEPVENLGTPSLERVPTIEGINIPELDNIINTLITDIDDEIRLNDRRNKTFLELLASKGSLRVFDIIRNRFPITIVNNPSYTNGTESFVNDDGDTETRPLNLILSVNLEVDASQNFFQVSMFEGMFRNMMNFLLFFSTLTLAIDRYTHALRLTLSRAVDINANNVAEYGIDISN